MILSIYDLMGENVSPPIDELTKREHVDFAIQVTSSTFILMNVSFSI